MTDRTTTEATSRRGALRAYVELTKPRIIELLLITTVPAMVVAEGGWPGQVGVLAPTLDDPAIAAPGAHVYVSHRQPWVKLADGLPTHEKF